MLGIIIETMCWDSLLLQAGVMLGRLAAHSEPLDFGYFLKGIFLQSYYHLPKCMKKQKIYQTMPKYGKKQLKKTITKTKKTKKNPKNQNFRQLCLGSTT